MLTREQLMDLFQDLRDHDVLSVYVDADQRDPAQRDAWRIRLDGDVSRLRRTLEQNGAAHLDAFDGAWEMVAHRLRTGTDAEMASRGWVAFATPDRIWHAGGVPAHMPPLVAWQRGIHAAPYVRALKQERPVTVVLADGRRARVFEQVEGKITEIKGVVADASVGEITDANMRKASARSTGVRGETSTDQAQRAMDIAAERLRKELADIVVARAGHGGIVVVGGPTEAAKPLASLLHAHLGSRVAEWQSLHLEMTPAEVKEEVRRAAGDMRERAHLALVESVAGAARAGRRGALGENDTLAALEGLRVDTLLLSRSFLRDHPRTADHAVGLAFGQGAEVEELSGEAGERLDEEGSGIAAKLRY